MVASTAFNGREWVVAGATMSAWHPTRLITGYAWDALTAAALVGETQPPKSLLLLGLGGGTVARQLLHLFPAIHITAVDIDPEALDFAKRNLDRDYGRLTVFEADAYEWLEESHGLFDCILDDVYAAGPLDVFRPKDLGTKLLTSMRSRLNPGGIFAANFVHSGSHDVVLRDAKRRFLDRFPMVAEIHPPEGYNAVLVGGGQLDCGRIPSHATSWAPAERPLWSRITAEILAPNTRPTRRKTADA